MSHRWSIFLATASFAITMPAHADTPHAIPATAIPTVQCIHRVLRSSSAVKSVALYSLDGRFAVEYVFHNKKRQAVTYDIELLIFPHDPVMVADKVPREVSGETADEAQELEAKLDLYARCNLINTFDNLRPPQPARVEWVKIAWPRVKSKHALPPAGAK